MLKKIFGVFQEKPEKDTKKPVEKKAEVTERTSRMPDPKKDRRPVEKTGPRSQLPAVVKPHNINRQTPDDKTLAMLSSWNKPVLTISGNEEFETTAEQRKLCAYLDGGIFLANKNEPLNANIVQVRAALKRMQWPITVEYLVEYDVIRKIYERAESRYGGKKKSTVKMQEDVLKLIREAASKRASDVHINVERHESRFRLRTNGEIHGFLSQKTAEYAGELCAAAFYMTDASEAMYHPLEYQAARMSNIKTSELASFGVQSVRMQYNPSAGGGRYLVMRLLYEADSSAQQADIDSLGYNKKVHLRAIKKMRKKPFGINIICGPTGSGKSTTLKNALETLMKEKPGKNVITIEDPPEYVIVGATQLPVMGWKTDKERAEAFSTAIIAALRDDPDIIMIGEVRDEASSGLAFQAAMTGHQVWCSLHANNSLSILDRLRDNHVENFKLYDASLVTGLVSQRLVKRLCPHCAINYQKAISKGLLTGHDDLNSEILRVAGDRLQNVRFANPNGCEHCDNGYSGREVIAEAIVPDLSFMNKIKNNKQEALEYWLESMDGLTILEHALQKVVKGTLDPREAEEAAGEFDAVTDSRLKKVFNELMD